jgi:epoxyqueuosine reductase QueG
MTDWDEEMDFWMDYYMVEGSSKKKKSAKKKKQSDGCYIATCVYGCYDCPEVCTLRRYRDYTLKKTALGRLFVKFYYLLSPTAVRLFGNKRAFKRFWRAVLNKMVKALQEKGFDSTPYKDNDC